MFDRNDAFSMKIEDPESEEDLSPILNMLTIDDDLILFKTNGIYRMLTAETLDPNATELETKHSYEKLYSIGTTSPYVARLIIQFEEIVNLVIDGEANKKQFIAYLWSTNKLLLDCCSVKNELSQQLEPLILECNELIEANKSKGNIPPLPKIPYLENQVRSFLNNSKLFLIEVFKVLNIFFDMPITDRSGAHFTKHVKWIKSELGQEHPIYKLLEQDIDWIRTLSESRNAMEHPEDGQRLYVENFKLQPGNKFSQPSWSYDLTKKLNKKSDLTDLAHDLDIYTYNMFSFFEELIAIIISNKLKEHKLLSLYTISDQQTNMECPIKYRVGLKSE
jgi:hypothetical protein